MHSLPLPLAPEGQDAWFWLWCQDYRNLGRPLGEDAQVVYRSMWGKYLRYLEFRQVIPETAKQSDIASFLLSLSPKQKDRYTSLLRRIYTYVLNAGIYQGELPVLNTRPKKNKHVLTTLSASERKQVVSMLAARQDENDSLERLRNKALTALFLGSGVTVEEALAIVAPIQGKVCVPEMKHRPRRVITLAEDCRPALDTWLSKATTPLFPSIRGKTISASTAWRGVSWLLADVGITGAGPEMLRTSWILQQLAMFDYEQVGQLAGLKERESLAPYINLLRSR